jgi:hypothetical protein
MRVCIRSAHQGIDLKRKRLLARDRHCTLQNAGKHEDKKQHPATPKADSIATNRTTRILESHLSRRLDETKPHLTPGIFANRPNGTKKHGHSPAKERLHGNKDEITSIKRFQISEMSCHYTRSAAGQHADPRVAETFQYQGRYPAALPLDPAQATEIGSGQQRSVYTRKSTRPYLPRAQG